MKHLTGILAILNLILLCTMLYLVSHGPRVHEGYIVSKTEDSIIVEFSIPVGVDQLIGLDVGDPYFLQEVKE